MCLTYVVTGAIDSEEKEVKEISLALSEEVPLELVWIDALNGWVGKYEITNDQFRQFAPNHVSTAEDGGKYLKGRDINQPLQPVVQVGLREAKTFCNWLNEHLILDIPEGFHFRLPDGVEWMTYSKCGDDRKYPWGSEWPPAYGNYADAKSFAHIDAMAGWEYIHGYTDDYYASAPATKSGRNTWGLYGVGGNVWEWTDEIEGENLVMRGGSWGTDRKDYLRCNSKRLLRPQFADRGETHVGFRLVLMPTRVAKSKTNDANLSGDGQ